MMPRFSPDAGSSSPDAGDAAAAAADGRGTVGAVGGWSRHALYTPREVASMLKCSADKVLRECEAWPGVVDIAMSRPRGRRTRRMLRIPGSAIDAYLSSRSNGGRA